MPLPGAWSALLKEPDSPLLDLLADKVEDLCGYDPSWLCVANFSPISQSLMRLRRYPFLRRP